MNTSTYFLGIEDSFISPQASRITWYISGALVRILLIFIPGTNILFLTSPSNQEQTTSNLIIKLLLQVMYVLVGAWFNFKYFVTPDTPHAVIPDTSIRTSRNLTCRMMLDFSFVFFLLTYIRDSVGLFFGEDYHQQNFLQLLISSSMLAVWFCDKVTVRIYNKGLLERENDLSQLSIAGKTADKIKKRLNEEEMDELSNLIYQEEQINQITISRLYDIVWLAIICALIINVIQEIGKRLLVGLIS